TLDECDFARARAQTSRSNPLRTPRAIRDRGRAPDRSRPGPTTTARRQSPVRSRSTTTKAPWAQSKIEKRIPGKSTPTLAATPLRCPQRGRNSRLGGGPTALIEQDSDPVYRRAQKPFRP